MPSCPWFQATTRRAAGICCLQTGEEKAEKLSSSRGELGDRIKKGLSRKSVATGAHPGRAMRRSPLCLCVHWWCIGGYWGGERSRCATSMDTTICAIQAAMRQETRHGSSPVVGRSFCPGPRKSASRHARMVRRFSCESWWDASRNARFPRAVRPPQQSSMLPAAGRCSS